MTRVKEQSAHMAEQRRVCVCRKGELVTCGCHPEDAEFPKGRTMDLRARSGSWRGQEGQNRCFDTVSANEAMIWQRQSC